MGANIDYATVIANRYTDLKREMPLQDAVVESLNEAPPGLEPPGDGPETEREVARHV